MTTTRRKTITTATPKPKPVVRKTAVIKERGKVEAVIPVTPRGAKIMQEAINGSATPPMPVAQVRELKVYLVDANVYTYRDPAEFFSKDGMYYIRQAEMSETAKKGDNTVTMTSQGELMFPLNRITRVEIKTVRTKVNGK